MKTISRDSRHSNNEQAFKTTQGFKTEIEMKQLGLTPIEYATDLEANAAIKKAKRNDKSLYNVNYYIN